MADDDHNSKGKPPNDELEPEQMRKVFIGSLSYRMSDDAFREYWTKFGNVLDSIILRDRDGRSRGFGFVTFADSSSVDAVMKARPHKLDNREVEPKRAVPREDVNKPDMQSSVKKLYLGGVKEPLTNDDLKDYFCKYGTITDAVVMKDRDGQYRGFGFVEFDDYDPVDRIILEKNHIVCGRSLDVQKAQPKDSSQRFGAASGNMRSRPPPPPPLRTPMSRPDFGGFGNYYDDAMDYPQNNFGPFGPMHNDNFGGGPFGQGYGQETFGGPMRRGHMGGSRGHSPYFGRGRGRGGGGGGNRAPSWTSWD